MSAAVRLALALSLALAVPALPLADALAQSAGAGLAPRPTNPPPPQRGSGAAALAPNAAAAPTAGAPEGVVNINTATEEELTRLPLIGPARAALILSLRQRLTRFRAADDLVRVRGIGRASMRRLRPFVTLQGDTTLASRPGARRSEEGAP